MPSSRYSVVEPHPTANTFMHSGRGGAGNTFKVPKTSSPSSARGPASIISSSDLAHQSGKFSSGRGGAGNIHPTSEKALFSFDEELERQNTRERKIKDGAVYHVGRGGAGNFAQTRAASKRKDSSSSGESDGSSRSSGFFSRLSHTFERN